MNFPNESKQYRSARHKLLKAEIALRKEAEAVAALMAEACPMCTSMLDSLNGSAQHIAQRTNLVAIARSPLPRILEFARGRGWSTLLNVFVKGRPIRHFYGTELLSAGARQGLVPEAE